MAGGPAAFVRWYRTLGHARQPRPPGSRPTTGAPRRPSRTGRDLEGWAHYAERLCDEIGLLRDPGERLGMLYGQRWRAARMEPSFDGASSSPLRFSGVPVGPSRLDSRCPRTV
ncbi:DUF885 family protein [Micromonospora sp. MP36]|uniref:DUF885 family protein n=1 Tax=Micromonospora sp. MP36 TaxID=2604468 RepID=UPI00351B73F3